MIYVFVATHTSHDRLYFTVGSSDLEWNSSQSLIYFISYEHSMSHCKGNTWVAL